VNIRAHQFSVSRVEIGFSWRLARILDNGFHCGIDIVELIRLVDVRNISSIQYIIEIFQEWFIFNLQKYQNGVNDFAFWTIFELSSLNGRSYVRLNFNPSKEKGIKHHS
jgi:hypothetical protein